jgi:mannose-binding lectin
MTILYAQTTGNPQTNANVLTPIPGLNFLMPGGSTTAIIILNFPAPWAAGPDFPGGAFGIEVGGTVLPNVAFFTYNDAQPQSTGRVPTTLVVGVPLTPNPQQVQAMWQGIRGSTVFTDGPSSLTAIIAP